MDRLTETERDAADQTRVLGLKPTRPIHMNECVNKLVANKSEACPSEGGHVWMLEIPLPFPVATYHSASINCIDML